MWLLSISLLFVITGLWYRWRKKQFSTFKELGIPGPKPNIFVGNLMEMMGAEQIKCHEKWIKKYGKVLGYYLGAVPIMLVADIDLARKILIKDFHKFPNRPMALGINNFPKKDEPLTAQLVDLRNKRWKEIRRLITPSFSTSKLKLMSTTMNGAVDSCMDIIDQKAKLGKAFDIYDMYRGLTMDAIGRIAFGTEINVQNNPNNIMLKAFQILSASPDTQSFLNVMKFSFPELTPIWKFSIKLMLTIKGKGKNPFLELSNYTKEIVQDRRKSEKYRRKDLLQSMMDTQISESELNSITYDELTAQNIEDADKIKKSEAINNTSKKVLHMTDQEIIDNSVLSLAAGYETTSTALAFTSHLLIHYPEMQQKIRNEIREVCEKEGKLDFNSVQQMKYLDQFIMESLRMYPPFHLFVSREAAEDVQYGQYKIKKGMIIKFPAYYMHYDPELWEEPEKFNPDRFSQSNKSNIDVMAFQAFGTGPRNCVGMRFAQLAMKLALASILNKYELIKTEESDKNPISLKIYPARVAPAKGVYLKAIPI